MSRPPLQGIRVLELGQLIAGPFAGKVLGEFGADVIKVEPPQRGDPLRSWRVLHEGTSLWWHVQSRNKKSVTCDLRTEQGQEVVRRLAATSDVLIENFRPGTLESWGLDPETLRAANPRLIVLRVSGYGQNGPYRERPGFAAVAEAVGGLRYLTGEPGRIPVRAGVSLGDTLAALQGVIGTLLALYARDTGREVGQTIDVALYEAVFGVTESLLTEFSIGGVIRQPAGSALPGIAPSNAYACLGGGIAIIAANNDSIFQRLMVAIGRADLAADPGLATNELRVTRVQEIDEAIAAWTVCKSLREVLAILERADVPSARAYTASDIANDPHFRERGMVVEDNLPGGTPVLVPGILPKLSATPGSLRAPAPTLGQHTDEVLEGLGFDVIAREALRQAGVI